MIVWIDSEDGTRGGSVYLKGCHQDELEKGKESTYIRTDTLIMKIRVILRSWFSGYEIRGTVPREIPTLIWCRRKRGYLQSPAEEWSMLSKVAMRVFLWTSGNAATCVSRTTRESAKSQGFGILGVSYAKIDNRERVSSIKEKIEKEKKKRRVVFIVMDNGLIDKGYLRHLSIIDAIGCRHNVKVEVYGAGKRVSYRGGNEVHYNGYKMNPFEDAWKRNFGDLLFYLGCSRYEGLHMAVVEAAMMGIPSILSDIPAHRELQTIAREQLLLGKCVSQDIELLEKILDQESYALELKRCKQLADRFADIKNDIKEVG